MKIKYEFVNETVEIEVSEEWATVIADLDRQDYNTEHKETRRHCSLEAYNVDDALLASNEDVVADTIRKMENEKLYAAIAKLSPCQQRAVRMVYLEGRNYEDIARELGCDPCNIRVTVMRGIKNLKKFL